MKQNKEDYDYRPRQARSDRKCQECGKEMMVISIENGKHYYCPDIHCGYTINIKE